MRQGKRVEDQKGGVLSAARRRPEEGLKRKEVDGSVLVYKRRGCVKTPAIGCLRPIFSSFRTL